MGIMQTIGAGVFVYMLLYCLIDGVLVKARMRANQVGDEHLKRKLEDRWYREL